MSKTNHRRRAAARWVIVACLAVVAPYAWAQTANTNPEDEYKKLVKVDEEIQPLGETPFGESVNVFDGGLSFHVVDISIPGNGPTIQISRTFQADGDADIRRDNASFGDWDIDLPRFSTLTSNQSTIIQGPNQIGWLVNSVARTDRCTNFNGPPDQRIGRPGSEPLDSGAWWNEGYLLRIPGVADQDMLPRYAGHSPAPPQMPGLNFVGLSKGNWQLACLPTTANGEEGEAFLAIGPDGSKYWLNYLVYRPARAFAISRNIGFMFATRMEDRFGNSVTYTYDGPRISRIEASDGRLVTFAYTGDGTAIAQVTVFAGGATRTWGYSYAPSLTGQTLTGVTLPDGSTWAYNLSDLTFDVKSTAPPGHCKDPNLPDETVVKTGTITAPSGLQGSFEARPTRHGRSGVFEYCDAINATASGTEHAPRYTNNLALRKKTFSGAGILTQTWNYSYPVATASWKSECDAIACNYTTYSDVVDPSDNTTRYFFSNHADATEGKPIRTEYYAGVVSSSPVRIDTYAYAAPDQGPWPAIYGGSFNIYANVARAQSEVPTSEKHIYVDGDQYTWKALSFDAFARPTETQRYSLSDNCLQSPSSGYCIQERSSFQDDYAHWVIGLPLQNDNVTTGETVSRNVYDPSSLTLSERYRFGRKVMGYTFNAQGQLASFTDGNSHSTTLGNYKRGIPQSIGYPDGTSQSLVVDDFGQITSITNQAGATTSYGYTEIGRLGSITYPVGDSTAWNSKVFGYALIGASERGIAGAHWRRSVSQGAKVQMTYFDALLRPIIADTYRNDGGLYTSSRTDYDWKGRKTFQSYPYDGAPDLAAMDHGALTVYDALGRPVQAFQHSELGDLLTKTDYLPGISKRVTDPKGNQTTTSYQAFDQPSYDSVVSVQAPEGVLQNIARDVYGNPQSITQSGAGQSVTKTMTYDAEHRLCRTAEPESGSEIMAYDNADNLAWSVSGASLNIDGCGQDNVVDNSKTTRTYDSMNRVTSVVYPTGTLPSTFTYDALGNPATATSGMVGWTYGRNKLGLLTTEALAVDGWNWSLGYEYDGNGALSQVHYPDGEVVAYNPDALGRPTSVNGYASGIAYFPDGDVKSYALGNGAIYSAKKNERNLLCNFSFGNVVRDLACAASGAGNGSMYVSEDFAYDANGNVSQITDQSGSGQRSKAMSYDGLNRLLSATASNLWGTESYTYDTLNNIRTLTGGGVTHSYIYDSNNLLASITDGSTALHSFRYDARGNTIEKDGQQLDFDLANRLTSIHQKGDYTYDAAGRRVKKAIPGGAMTYYAYNSAGQLMWEYDQATTNGTDYIYLGKKLVANSKGPTSTIVGAVEAVNGGANATLTGWACSTGLATSIDVHLYAGGGSGVGTAVGAYHANLASEPAIQTACHASGSAYRFSIPLTEANRIQFAGQALFVHGISPVGGDNSLIAGSGNFTMPPSILAPNAPASVTATVSADLSTLTVTWAASPNVTSYTLERSWDGEPWPSVYSGAATSVSLPVAVDGSYVFRVKACNANGCSDPKLSNTVVVAHIPPAPGSISVPATSSGSVALGWPAAAYATSYQVEHSRDGNWAQIYSGAVTSASINESVTGNWYYRVRACNGNGCGGYATSGVVQVVLPPTVPPTLNGGGTSTNGAYGLNWTTSPEATVYNLIENVNGTGWVAVQYAAAQSWATAGKGNGTYYYMVQGCNASACTNWSNQVVVTVSLVPALPTGIGMTDTVSGKREMYTVYWNTVPGATRYEIQRVQPGTILTAPATGTSYVVESGQLPYELKYSYRLRACNDQGCSEWSGAFAG